MSLRETVSEVSGKEFIEDSSQEIGFFKCRGYEDSFKSKGGVWMLESWCKKLRQSNDTSKQTPNVPSSSNVGNKTNKANVSKIKVKDHR